MIKELPKWTFIAALSLGLTGASPAGEPEAPPLPEDEGAAAMRETIAAHRRDRVLDEAFERFPEVDREAVLRYLHEEFPREMRRLTELARHHVQEAADYLSDLVVESMDMMEIRSENPEHYRLMVRERELEERSEVLADRIREGDDSDEANREVLRDVLEQAFETKQELMKLEVEALESEIEELREFIEQRKVREDAIIERRMSELLDDLDALEW